MVLQYIKGGNQNIEAKATKRWKDNSNWHNITYTWNGNVGVFYVDGKKIHASVKLGKIDIAGEKLLVQIGSTSRTYSSGGSTNT